MKQLIVNNCILTINCSGYNPEFPASSPYVTTVGGTQGPELGLPEMSCSLRHRYGTVVTVTVTVTGIVIFTCKRASRIITWNIDESTNKWINDLRTKKITIQLLFIHFINHFINYITVLFQYLFSGFTAGGGFSNIYETPSWQKNAVNDYFSHVEELADGNNSLLPYVNSTTTRLSKSYPYSNYNGKGRGNF